MTLGDKIRAAREAAGLTQEELGKKCGTTKQTIYKYEIGKITNIPLDRLEKIADIVGVTTTSLLGWEPEDRPSIPTASNILPMPEMRKIPLLGTIACGAPVLAEEHIEGQVDILVHIHADFALTCKGDSMINARIFDGDIVYIRQQDTVENGEIAAVLIETEAQAIQTPAGQDHPGAGESPVRPASLPKRRNERSPHSGQSCGIYQLCEVISPRSL